MARVGIIAMDAVKKALAEEFSMKDVGELAFLSIQISRDRANRTITIRQILDAKPVSIPIIIHSS